MKHQQPLQSLDGSGWMTRERVLKLPVLEIFGPTFQGQQDVITIVIGVILPSLGMVQRNQLV